MSIPADQLPRREFPWGLAALLPILVLGAGLITLAAEPDVVLRFLPHVPKSTAARVERYRGHRGFRLYHSRTEQRGNVQTSDVR